MSVQGNGRGRALPAESERLQKNEDTVEAKVYHKMVEHYDVQVRQWPLSNEFSEFSMSGAMALCQCHGCFILATKG